MIVTLPSSARTANEVNATSWQIRHVLSAGIHGILHTHVRQSDAVGAFVEACRYPFHDLGLNSGLGQGQRGSGGQRFPSQIWGVSTVKYSQLADPWPLNPDGELMLGLKIEDREGASNADYITKVPGIAFAEWGPSDMTLSFGYDRDPVPPRPDDVDRAFKSIKDACEAAGLVFLDGPDTSVLSDNAKALVRSLLDRDVRIISGGSEEMARTGREISGRTMPV